MAHNSFDLFVFVSLLAILTVTFAKICCDQDCRKPISYGRTKDRYITQEEGHLSFPNAAIVTVLGKDAATDTSGQEMWLAEIQGRKGLIPAGVISELHTLCEPKHIIEESANSQDNENVISDSGWPGPQGDSPSPEQNIYSNGMDYQSPGIQHEQHQEQQQRIIEQGHSLKEQQVNPIDQHVLEQHNSFVEQQDRHVSSEQHNILEQRRWSEQQENIAEEHTNDKTKEYTAYPSSQETLDEQPSQATYQEPSLSHEYAHDLSSDPIMPGHPTGPTFTQQPDDMHGHITEQETNDPESMTDTQYDHYNKQVVHNTKHELSDNIGEDDGQQQESLDLSPTTTDRPDHLMVDANIGDISGTRLNDKTSYASKAMFPESSLNTERSLVHENILESTTLPTSHSHINKNNDQAELSHPHEYGGQYEQRDTYDQAEQRNTYEYVDQADNSDRYEYVDQAGKHEYEHVVKEGDTHGYVDTHEYVDQDKQGDTHEYVDQDRHGDTLKYVNQARQDDTHEYVEQKRHDDISEHVDQDRQGDKHEYIDQFEQIEKQQYVEQAEKSYTNENVGHTVKSNPQDKIVTEPRLVTLKNGDIVQVKPLGGGRVEMTTHDSTVKTVDYEYFYDFATDLQDVLDYDYSHDVDNDVDDDNVGDDTYYNNEDSGGEQMTDHVLPKGNVDTQEYEHYSSGNSEAETSNKRMYEEAELKYIPDPVGDHQPHHTSYLDVNSLRQRYQRDKGTTDTDKPIAVDETDYRGITPDNTQYSHTVHHYTTEDVDHTVNVGELTHDETPIPTTVTRYHDNTQIPLEEQESAQTPSEGQGTQQYVPPDPIYVSPPVNAKITHPDVTNLPTADADQHVPQQEFSDEKSAEPMHHEFPFEYHSQLSNTDDDEDDRFKQQERPLFNTDHNNYRSEVWIIDFISEFSPSLASWILQQSPEIGVIGVSTSVLALVIPLCCSCCHYWKDSRRKSATISKQSASRRALEEQIQRFKSEKSEVKTELHLLEERCSTLENELEKEQQNNNSLTEAKADVEDNYRSVFSDLQSAQLELTKCTTELKQLHSELKHEQMQLSAQTSDKEVALQQIALLQGQMQEYEHNVQELEAAKEQLEQNVFSTQNSHQQLETLHTQVSQELIDSKTENSGLKSRLQSLEEEVLCLKKAKNDNEQEIQTLQNCLNQLMVSTMSEEGGQEEEIDGDIQERDSAELLKKIQAMLDTTKVQTELQAATEERDKTVNALEQQTSLVRELQVENTSLHHQIQEVESQLRECNANLQKLQDKHKTLTEYFEQKEHNLHRKLGAEEAVRQAVESREAQVKEKAESLEQTETRHREELKQLRSEMFEIEKSLMAQVHTCQKRAEEAIAEQRRLEQECKALKLEREDLRKRISTKSLSPSGGPTDRHHSLIARPPSAPYLPRTSSPGDHYDHVTSMLSHTDPLPGSHPSLQGPSTVNPDHHSQHHLPPDHSRDQHLPPFQGPLRHPVPRPRYPPPPPGRRVIRGYPPFDRRPPMIHPRGVYGPVHHFPHDMRDTNTLPERRRPLSNPPLGARSTPPLGYHHPAMPNSSAGFVPVVPAVPEPYHQQSNPQPQENQVAIPKQDV